MVIFAVSFKPVSQQESICGQRNQIQEEPESKARKSVNACLPQRTQLCRLRVSETGTAGLSNGRAVRGKEMRTDGRSLSFKRSSENTQATSEKVRGKWTSDKVLRQIRKATQVSLRLTGEAIITGRCHKAANCIRAACDDQTFHISATWYECLRLRTGELTGLAPGLWCKLCEHENPRPDSWHLHSKLRSDVCGSGRERKKKF